MAGIGFEARFGPEGSPFAGKFFAVTMMNSSVYQVTADGGCTSSVRFEARGGPTGIATRPTRMSYAPEGFGAYGGQLCVADLGGANIQITQATEADGRVYRVDAAGDVQPVASGFHNPVGLHFVGDTLWVTDINGDFIAGRRELPEWFVVELSPTR